MFEPDYSDLSYPLSFPRVKTRTLRLSSGLNPNQLTAISVGFRSEITFPSDNVSKLTEQALS